MKLTYADGTRQIADHRRPDDQVVGVRDGDNWVTPDPDADEIGPIPDLPPYQTPAEGERRILTTGLVGTLCQVDAVAYDEEDDVRDTIDALHPALDPFPDVYMTALYWVSASTPDVNLPNYNANIASFRNWVENPTMGGATAAWIAATAAWSDDAYKGACFYRAGHVPAWAVPAYESLTGVQWVALAADNGIDVSGYGSKATAYAAIVDAAVTGDNTGEKEGVLGLVQTYDTEQGLGAPS